MEQRTFRPLLAATFALLAASVAQAQILPGTGPTVTFELKDGSYHQEGCLPPCLCPVLFTDSMVGTMDLTQIFLAPVGVDVYQITDIDWVLTDFFGATRSVTGDGTYTIGMPGPVVAPPQSILLNLSIEGGPVETYVSGPMAITVPFPQIDIAAALNGFFCYDYVWNVVACPKLFTSFCTSTPNSTGSPAVISATGSASVTANDLELFATNCPPNEPGVFYYGPNEAQIPFGNGFRCVTGSGIFRLPVVFASGQGVMFLAVDNQNLQLGGQFIPGDTKKFQAWFRDPAAGGAGFDLSDGASITFLP